MYEFLQQNASAMFALAGALGTTLLALCRSWVLSKRDFDLKLWDKLLERRIKAHEDVILVAIDMRIMVALGGVDDVGEVQRAPQILVSKEFFEQWFIKFTESTQTRSTWLSTAAKREVYFVQDYLVTLHQHLSSVPDDNYLKVGKIIRQDFIDISSSLEKTAFRFFEKDMRKTKIK